MADQQHPITPPDELVKQWTSLPLSTEELLVIAYRAGSDMELEACCEWLEDIGPSGVQLWGDDLRTDRRPKPPEPPTDEELMALAITVFNDHCATDKDYARAVLERWGQQ